jgi:hypothetical protein
MAGWNDPAETIVAGTGQVYVAPTGTAEPANVDSALNAAFQGLGYHTEEGVSVNKTLEIVEFKAWQSRYAIRRERDTEEFQLTFVLEQWNEVTTPLAFGGGEIVPLGGDQFKFVPPGDDDSLDERALVCDVQDGDRKIRFVVPRGTVTEGVESSFQRTEMANLPITFKALEPEDAGDAWYFLTNDAAAYAAGS